MEDLKQIQEFFSKPLEEKMVTPKRGHNYYQLYRDTPIKYISGRSGIGLEIPGVLLHNEYDTINGQEGAYIIDYFGQHFYVDMENKFASKIANPRDPEQNEDLIKNMGRTAIAPEFSNWKKYLNVSLEEAKVDEAYIVTYAKNKGEKPASVAYKLRGSALAFMRDLEKDGYTTMLTQRPVDGVDEAVEEYNSGLYFDPDKASKRAKTASKSAMDKVRDAVRKAMTGDYKPSVTETPNEALADSEEKEANYDELYKDYKYKVDEAKPKKGHGEKVTREFFSKLKGKTINYKGADYKVLDSDEAVLKIKHLEDGDVTTINLRQFNLKGMIDEILETIELGKQLDEKKLCKKGEAYRKRRMAAGEKSSAYLSGRAVKVCKGQMSGRKRKSKKK